MEENKRITKIMSVIMLVVFTASNFFDSLNYVFAQETPEPLIDTGTEITAENGDEGNDLDTGDNQQQPEIDTGDNEQKPETDAGDNQQQPEIDTGDNEQKPETDTGDNEQKPETDAGDNQQQPEIENNEENTETTEIENNEENTETTEIENNEENTETVESENNEENTETTEIENNEENTETVESENNEENTETTETENNEENTETTKIENNAEEGTVDAITEEINEIINKIRYFFKREGNSNYIKYGKDRNNLGIITLKDPSSSASITIMDKNLGAESAGVGKNSYGYYFQWGNNQGVKAVNSSNKTTQKAVYNDSYYSRGYDGKGLFIVGSTDYWENGEHYNNLWGNESKESSRYGACPVGYHIPTMKEWNQLLSIWGKIHTQDTSASEEVLRYSADYSTRNIHTFKGAATQCKQGDTECVDEDKLSTIIEILSSELKLPLAGSYDENGNFHGGLGVYWASISKNGNSAGVFDVDAYIGERKNDTLLYKAQGHNIRCFQNLEPYEAPVKPEPQNDDNMSSGTEGERSSNDTPTDSQPAEQASTDESTSELQTGSGIDSSLDTQNDGNDTQDTSPENNIPSDIGTDSVIQDTTEDLVNEGTDAKEYTITWKNEDGTIIDTTRVAYGQKPTHANPVQPSDASYSYKFAGWEPELKVVEGDAVYKAKYIYIPIEYTITWKNEDGTIIDTSKVAYGQTPTHANPNQPADEKYSYKFAGWVPNLSEVKGNTEYRAKYSSTLNKYTITWKDGNGKVLKTEEVEYGVIPTYDRETPTKESTEEYEYIFTGWDKEITEVKGNITYTAKYDEKEIIKEIPPNYGDNIAGGEMGSESDYPISPQNNENILSGTVEKGSEGSNDGGGGGSTQDSLHNSEGQTGDVFTGSAIDLLEELLDDQTETGEVLEYTDEDRELELAQIRNTLNKKKIKGKETYNNITVNVEAPKGAFPEGVELRINPIIGDAENQAIKEQLMENTEVTEDSELVSFDISFIYTLSNGEEVELQPRDGNTVKVSFNYKNNNKFNKGKKEKNKDLKIYHFEKVKYKKDKKSEKTQIKEIKINESESTESEIVIDADSFSVYSVALVDGAGEEQDNFDVPMLKAISNTSVDPGWNRDNSKGTVTITLNANGGSFSNSSSTKNLDYGYYTRTETKYAHTSNYNDNGTSNGNCSSSDEKTTTVEIAGATKLDIEVSYGLSRTILGSDSLRIVADGIDRTFSNSTNSWEGSTNGNSVSFTLNLAGRIFSGYPKGYYAVIVGTIPVGWRTQDNVEEPTREGYEFVDWYTDTSYTTVFDDENYNFENGGTTVYAKWTCAEGYTEVGGECKKDCNVPASLGGGTIHHGQSVTGYQSASVPYGQTCQSEARICNNGTLEGSYTYQSCQTEQPTGCTLPWGGTTGHGAIVTAYTTSSVTCPTACTPATATCNNGVWSVNNFTGTYTNQTCTTNSVTCDGFTLNSTGANGTYSGCTPYMANGNSCNVGTTKYKLDSCNNGYHTEDNSTCTGNTKTVACIQSGKPDHSSYVSGNVQITWQGAWNNGSWSTADNCAWTCDSHYHTGANGTSCEINTFQITWKDGNGNTLKIDTVNYNETPVYAGATPTKTATAQYSYTFNNTWSPTIVPATTDATYTAQFNSIVNEYTITWNYRDANGVQTQSTDTVAFGQTPSAPSLPATSQSQSTVYTFTSWSPAVHSVDGTETYTAQYSESPRQYTITWKNDDGTTIDTTTVNYGTTPTHADATKANTAQYTYTFAGWTPSIESVTGDATYTATFNSTVNEYTITWKDGDGATLKTEQVAYGQTPSYVGSTPTKTADNTYTYTWNNTWSPAIVSVTADATYTAQFTPEYIDYTITWKDRDGTTLSGATYHYNDNLVVLAGPSRAADETYTYTFNSWTPAPSAKVTADKTYTATYDSEYIDYTITFTNRDNGIISSRTYHYGESVTIPSDPSKPADAQYTYSFAGWSPSVTAVTGNQTYTAQFTPQLRSYTINIVSSDTNSGTVTTGSITVPYGTSISKVDNVVTIGTETSTANANSQTWQYDFSFVDWTDTCGTAVTTGCIVTANFQSLLRTYTLDLVFGTGIETIYYKINGADNFASTGVTTTISGVEAGSEIIAYAEAKTGYTHLETSSSNPWTVIVTGNNVFSPVATVGTGIQYTVYHYVKIAGESGYALSKTETLYGTSDEILTLSSLANESEFLCAHYDRGSLTGTEDGPGEIVTQTTIKGDGTTEIYLYYIRTYHRIVLSGDAHIENLEGDGVRECGSERPINATPKPGYHFVRWDREERTEEEEGGDEPSG